MAVISAFFIDYTHCTMEILHYKGNVPEKIKCGSIETT